MKIAKREKNGRIFLGEKASVGYKNVKDMTEMIQTARKDAKIQGDINASYQNYYKNLIEAGIDANDAIMLLLADKTGSQVLDSDIAAKNKNLPECIRQLLTEKEG